jgi:hypothetical protein
MGNQQTALTKRSIVHQNHRADLNLLRIGRRDLIAAGLGAATVAVGVAPAQAQQVRPASSSSPIPSGNQQTVLSKRSIDTSSSMERSCVSRIRLLSSSEERQGSAKDTWRPPCGLGRRRPETHHDAGAVDCRRQRLSGDQQAHHRSG